MERLIFGDRSCLLTTMLWTADEAMKVRDLLRQLDKDGWYLARMKGSHRQYKHPSRPGLVTVAGHLSDELARGTLKNIKKQAGMTP